MGTLSSGSRYWGKPGCNGAVIYGLQRKDNDATKSTVQHSNSIWGNHKHFPGQPNVPLNTSDPLLPAASYTHIDFLSFAARQQTRQIQNHLKPGVQCTSMLYLCG